MKFYRLILAASFAFPVVSSAASKEIVELQRDVAQLQDQVRTLQSSFDTKMGTIAAQVQQLADSAGRANNSLATLQGAIQEQLRQQGKEVIAPVASVGSKIDEMATAFQQVQNSMADVTARMGKLEQQVMDLSNAVRTMNSPAAPPGSNLGPGNPGPTTSNMPPISGDMLYQNANRDRLGGKADIALQEYQEYVKLYGDGPLAPAAEYWVGDLYFSQGDFENALKAFDQVLERYPANNKTPDALLMKGKTLVKLDKRNAGASEFRELIRRYPGSDAAVKARAQLKQMGLSASPSLPARRK
ncbi:MAG TPA: tol-pal system protein YbgF [Bryobacteraceae bacterium]|jgi:tol-pal system protein YbgF|nr:tol-pal system protein YbgF [Candidatus Binatia bacterium]HWY86970.1 tol-pal system protein YbgF [Gemmataceae bacterium]HXA05257.1 tol-pal system protein YbgF [Bryobacteraceae bacterium]